MSITIFLLCKYLSNFLVMAYLTRFFTYFDTFI